MRVCQNCGKGVMIGRKATRARQELIYRSPKAFRPNLHATNVKLSDGTKKKMLFCTKCKRMVKKYVVEHGSFPVAGI